MPELLKSYVIRNAELLTPKQIETIGIQSHPAALQSKRFGEWHKLCEAGRYQEVEAHMRNFLESEEAIRSTKQIPAALRKPIEFAEYNGYQFKNDEFLRHLDTGQLSREFGERDKDGRYGDDSSFKKVYSTLADQLIAKARISGLSSKSSIDEQAVLKTLKLIERAYAGRRGNFDVNVRELYALPIILSHCLINMDPCKDITYTDTPKPGDVHESVIPNKCECKCNTDCVPQNPCCAKITPYIADLFVVRDEIRCYEVGEMSYIENVLQSEIRVRKHRTLEREELLTEQTNESAFSEEKDHQVDEKFSLQKEIDKTVEEGIKLDAGVTANQNWGTGDVQTTTNVGYNQSKKDAQKSVQDYVKQVIDKSVTKLEKKVREFSSRKLFRESEETNKHVFGGTSGAPNDISRQFFYVNIVKRAQVYNYGKRMLLDFYLPEPSELYKRLVDKQFKLKKPEKPPVKVEEITDKNYMALVTTYGLEDFEMPPKMTTQVQIPINLHYGYSHTYTESLGFVVPDNYEAVSMHTGSFNFDSERNPWEFIMVLAGQSISNTSSGNVTNASLTPHLTGGQTITTKSNNLYVIQGAITIECQLLPEFSLKWRLSIYNKIMEAYQKELDAYNEALAEFEKNKQSKYQQNPFILLQDMQEQLKQAAISYISCQFFDSMNAMKHMVEPCGFPQMDLPETEKEGEFVRFFEQAFEWKFMNFIFYPYFWGRKCTWEEKMQEEADNLLFQRFLRAGYARVSVSVRPGFEGHINYFLKTKQIWGQVGQPPIAGPDFVPIYQEIKEDKDNFNTDREGTINVLNGVNTITLNGTDQYWDYGNPLALPTPIPPGIDANKIAADINREIFIDGKQYRIVSIQLLTAPSSWTITLDRPYEGADAGNLPWSTGALFVGAPWEFKIPTRLVWLREKGGCLPCYPVECGE